MYNWGLLYFPEFFFFFYHDQEQRFLPSCKNGPYGFYVTGKQTAKLEPATVHKGQLDLDAYTHSSIQLFRKLHYVDDGI